MRNVDDLQTQNAEQAELTRCQTTFNEFVLTQIAHPFSLASSNAIAQGHVNRNAGD